MTTFPLRLRNRHFFLIDLLLLPSAAVLSFVLRLDVFEMQRHLPSIPVFIALALPTKLVVFGCLGLYRRFWRYASVDEILFIILSTGVSSLLTAAIFFALVLPLSGITRFPRSVILIDGLLTMLVVAAPRFAVRVAQQRRQRERRRQQQEPEKRVLVMGAGDAGAMIVKEMRANPQLGLLPVGFVDDDERKYGVRIHGLPVLGGRERIPELVQDHKVAEVIIAMPTVPGSAIREILAICNQATVPTRIIPGLYDIISGQVSVSQIRDVEIGDLLRREPVEIEAGEVVRMVRDKRVLVTGAGGSIGLEICRQVAQYGVAELVLLGHGENSIFHAMCDLTAQYPDLTLHPAIADIRDRPRLEAVFRQHEPHIVFHAAAHKHVPLMECNVEEAVSNNVLGTNCLIEVVESAGVERFVLISTDKAVNPCSVMGATKRVAELLVEAAAARNGRIFVTVRFGNVLGSRGSVVGIFREQIARGGPVTVTHPDMRRYFMTIPEAVQLVLQAAAIGRGGEVFVLDMGEPVAIVDLAHELVRLSGLEVGRDIDIEFIGTRPGEKLFEELFADGETYHRTHHEKIFVCRNGPEHTSHASRLTFHVDALIAVAERGEKGEVRRLLQELVPEYRPATDGWED